VDRTACTESLCLYKGALFAVATHVIGPAVIDIVQPKWSKPFRVYFPHLILTITYHYFHRVAAAVSGKEPR